MTVHDGTVDGTVRKSQKGKKWPFDPILALLSSSQNVACVLFTQTNDRCSNERKNFKVFVLTRISWSQLFTAKKHLTVGLHSNYGRRSPRPTGRSTPSFLRHRNFDALTVRTVHRTVIEVQNCSNGVTTNHGTSLSMDCKYEPYCTALKIIQTASPEVQLQCHCSIMLQDTIASCLHCTKSAQDITVGEKKKANLGRKCSSLPTLMMQ